MPLIDLCIRRPVTVSVVVALVVIFGTIALRRVPVQLTPNVDQPVVSVTTTWFGNQPEDIVREIIEPQEEKLKSVSGLREMTSSASIGEAYIRLEFSVGTDTQAALAEVRDKLRQVPSYPPDVNEPIVEATDRFSRDYIAWILVRPIEGFEPTGPRAGGFDGDITKLGTFMEDFVKPILERSEGVSEIQVLGGRFRELQVRVNLERLAARGLTLQQVVNALRTENADATAGTIDEGKRQTSVRITGQFTSPEQVAATPITFTSEGAPVYVGDVAEVVEDFKKEIGFVRALGVPVIAINAQREVGSNVLEVMANLRRSIEEVNRDVLGPTNWGIELHQVYDQTIYINQAVSQAGRNLLIGACLAGLVLFVTLRSFGATIVIMVAIPISVIGTILGMQMFGRSLNVISLSGLTFAVGMGIDNAIVVLENIFRHREMGKDRFKAAVDGASEVAGAIVASTLTNVAVFVPIIFIQEEAGQLFRDISVALTISFFIYLFTAPTVIPMLTSLLLRRMPPGLQQRADQAKRATLLGRLTQPIARAGTFVSERFYRLTFFMTSGWIRRLAVVGVMVIGSSVLAILLIPPRDYLPAGNQNLVFGFILTPPGYNVEENRSIAADHIEPRLAPWWSVKPDSPELRELQDQWQQQNLQQRIPQLEGIRSGIAQSLRAAGASESDITEATAFFTSQIEQRQRTLPPPAIDNFFFVSFGPNLFMGATSTDYTNVKPLSLLMTEAVEGLPASNGFFFQASIFRTSGGVGSAVSLDVTGDDVQTVTAAATAVNQRLQQVFGFARSDPNNFDLGQDEVRIIPDRVRAAAAGLTGLDVRNIAQAAVDGIFIGDYRPAGARSIDLTVLSDRGRTDRSREELANLPLVGADRQIVPLKNAANIVNTTAPQTIRRFQERPSVQFNVQLPGGMTVGQASDIIQAEIVKPLTEQGVLGPQATVRLAGAASKLQDFQRAFVPGLLLAVLVTYLLLSALYENFIYPVVILLSVPFAMVGGLVGLAILHWVNPEFKLDVLTMLGFVILIGTIINSPILIVYQSLNFMRAGMDQRTAIATSTQTRVRPIFMSVTTTLAGLSPLVFLGGQGSELYRGLGSVLVGGLALSTFFTLLLTPTLMSLLLDVYNRLSGSDRFGRLSDDLQGRDEDESVDDGLSETDNKPSKAAKPGLVSVRQSPDLKPA